jgi:hypothetical protein
MLEGAPPRYGRLIGSNAPAFDDLSIPGNRRSGEPTLRITGIRANANAPGVASGRSSHTPIIAAITLQKTASSAAPANAQTPVGLVMRSFTFRVKSKHSPQDFPFALSQAFGVNADLINDPNRNTMLSFYLQFSESFPHVFKTSAEESVYGIALGTRLRTEFRGVPDNVCIFITTTDVSFSERSSPRAKLISGQTAREPQPNEMPATSGTFADGVPIQCLHLDDKGNRETVWEWVSNNPISPISVDINFGVVVAARLGIPWHGGAHLGTAVVMGSLAPTSTVTGATKSDPIPRFANTSYPIEVLTIHP